MHLLHVLKPAWTTHKDCNRGIRSSHSGLCYHRADVEARLFQFLFQSPASCTHLISPPPSSIVDRPLVLPCTVLLYPYSTTFHVYISHSNASPLNLLCLKREIGCFSLFCSSLVVEKTLRVVCQWPKDCCGRLPVVTRRLIQSSTTHVLLTDHAHNFFQT